MMLKFWIGTLDNDELHQVMRFAYHRIGAARGAALPVHPLLLWLDNVALGEYRRRQRCDAGNPERAAALTLPEFDDPQRTEALAIVREANDRDLSPSVMELFNELVQTLSDDIPLTQADPA